MKERASFQEANEKQNEQEEMVGCRDEVEEEEAGEEVVEEEEEEMDKEKPYGKVHGCRLPIRVVTCRRVVTNP
ncbi:hypothetical protein M0804_002339 [Polistes exclamans]|nr:hypothetical protein M0804_002339 [Polistes exclamans]